MPCLPPVVVLALLVSLVASACASSPTPETTTPEAEPAGEVFTASAFVQHLARLAASGDEAGLDAAIDHEFAARLPSGADLRSVFHGVPLGCEPVLSEGPGYAAIAIPPPMVDDSEEEAARIEALVDELRATTEVQATCMVTDGEGNEGEEDSEDSVTIALYTVAVRRTPAGWRALAWRDHRFE